MRKIFSLLLLLAFSTVLSAQKITFKITTTNYGNFSGVVVVEGTRDTITVDTIVPIDTAVVVISDALTRASFATVMGINGNIQLGTVGTVDGDMLRRKFKNFKTLRYFYPIEHDLHKVPLLKRFPKPALSKCPGINDGWNDGNANNKYRLCALTPRFDTVLVSLETIYYPGDTKHYPYKHLSLKNLGGKPYEMGVRYGEMLGKSLQGMNIIIEVSNEPHGMPYWELNAWSKGLYESLHKYGIKVSSSDLCASGPERFGSINKSTSVDSIDMRYVDILQMHVYIMDKHFKASIPPERSRPGYYSVLEKCRDMGKFARAHGKQWMMTEYGFDSNVLGEDTHAAYYLRAVFLAMRHGAIRTYAYNIQDEPLAAPFDATGFLTQDGREKQVFKAFNTWITAYKDYYFKRAVKDGKNGDFEYEFTNGEHTFKVEWNVDDKNIPKAQFID